MCDDIEDDEYYYTLSDLFTVDGLINNTGHEVERYTYDAYGKAVVTVVKPADVSHDGYVDPFDRGAIRPYGSVSCSSPPYYDLSGDGYVDPFDAGIITQNYGSGLSTSPRSSVGNPYLFTGRTTDLIHNESVSIALQDNRNRSYTTTHGRWLQRDPSGYTDGMNLYEYVKSGPTIGVDTDGRKKTCEHYCGFNVSSHMRSLLDNIRTKFQSLPTANDQKNSC